jgi:hypothetical protein
LRLRRLERLLASVPQLPRAWVPVQAPPASALPSAQAGPQRRRGRRLSLLLRDHLLLRSEQLGVLRAVDEAELDQDLAELRLLTGAALRADRLGELIHADHLQMDGEASEQRRGLRVGHASLSAVREPR